MILLDEHIDCNKVLMLIELFRSNYKRIVNNLEIIFELS